MGKKGRMGRKGRVDTNSKQSMRKNKQWAKRVDTNSKQNHEKNLRIRAEWTQIQNLGMRKNKQWAKRAEHQKGQSGHKFKIKS